MNDDASATLRTPSPEFLLLAGTVLLLAWAPIPFGSNRLWSASLLSAGAALLLAGCAAMAWRGQGFRVPTSRIRWPLALFGGAIAWGFVQWMPWTPQALHHPIWETAAAALGTGLAGRISANPAATLAGLANLMGYGAVFWVCLQLAANRQRVVDLLRSISLVTGLLAWYGLLVFLGGNETILFYDKWEYPEALTSTFINRNSFATYAGLGLVTCLSLLLRAVTPVMRSKSRTRIKISQALEVIYNSELLSAIAFIGLFPALMLTGSRAGIASTFVALLAVTVLMTRSKRGGLGKAVKASMVAVILLIALALPLSGLLSERLGRDDTSLFANDRIEVYRLTVMAISDTPLIGTGLGTFADIFPYYRDTDVFSPSAWTKAHSTYLEILLEFGLPAGSALISAVALLGWLCFRSAMAHRRSRAAPAAAAAATVLVGLHSTIDFSLQIPAVAATFAAVLGCGTGSALMRLRSGDAKPQVAPSP